MVPKSQTGGQAIQVVCLHRRCFRSNLGISGGSNAVAAADENRFGFVYLGCEGRFSVDGSAGR